jgi:myosin heavy subunit
MVIYETVSHIKRRVFFMETAKLALKLKNEGLSFRAIADRFNSESIPTPSGKGKWGHEQIKRLIAIDTKNKAEVKVGLVTENEVRLKAEVETLRSQLEQVSDLILERNDEIKRLKDVLVVKYRNSMDKLHNENHVLRDELKHITEHRNEIIAEVSRLENLTRDIETLITQKETFKAESERLQRLLNGAETNYLQQYHDETGRLGKELAIANQTIQELRDKQTFLQPESDKLVMVSENGVPKNYKGWTVGIEKRGYIRMFKKMSGKLHQFYVGKDWDESVVDLKIGEYTEKNLNRLKFAILSGGLSHEKKGEF